MSTNEFEFDAETGDKNGTRIDGDDERLDGLVGGAPLARSCRKSCIWYLTANRIGAGESRL